MVNDFEKIELDTSVEKPKVGIVGEVLIKYHPFGNNYVADKLEEEAKKKAEEIKKKCQDLVNLAIAKGTPVLENAAEELRLKAIDVVSEVLEKLESKEK